MSVTIPGLPASQLRQRSEWEGKYRVATWVRADGKHYIAPSLNIATVDGNIIHYPGSNADTIRSDTDARVIAHLRSIQDFYVNSRGYSVGYQFAIDERGHVWVLRGFDFKSAATAQHNGHTVAIYFIIGSNQRPSDAAIRSAQLVEKETARRCGRRLVKWNWDTGFWISGHNEARQYPKNLGGTPTSCCGAPTYALLHTKPVGDGGLLHPRELGNVIEPPDYGLFPLDKNKPAIGVGSTDDSSGGKVSYAQRVLRDEADQKRPNGDPLLVDGDYGNETKTATSNLQRFLSMSPVTGAVAWDGPNTWGVIDYLAAGVPIDPPDPPDPPTDVVAVTNARYFIRPGDSPWSATERCWGNGAEWETHFNRDQFDTANHYTTAKTGPAGVIVTIEPGEGPYAILERIGVDPTSDNLERFYAFNSHRVLHPGNKIYFPTVDAPVEPPPPPPPPAKVRDNTIWKSDRSDAKLEPSGTGHTRYGLAVKQSKIDGRHDMHPRYERVFQRYFSIGQEYRTPFRWQGEFRIEGICDEFIDGVLGFHYDLAINFQFACRPSKPTGRPAGEDYNTYFQPMILRSPKGQDHRKTQAWNGQAGHGNYGVKRMAPTRPQPNPVTYPNAPRNVVPYGTPDNTWHRFRIDCYDHNQTAFYFDGKYQQTAHEGDPTIIGDGPRILGIRADGVVFSMTSEVVDL